LARCLKGDLEFVAELDQVFHDLYLSVEAQRSGVMIEEGLHESFTIAFIKESFDIGPAFGLTAHVEREEFLDGFEFESSVVVFAFLKDSDG
jgi:hypothetical protein